MLSSKSREFDYEPISSKYASHHKDFAPVSYKSPVNLFMHRVWIFQNLGVYPSFLPSRKMLKNGFTIRQNYH